MASEPNTNTPVPPLPERFKYRLRFQKADDLRFVSHHDLMHCCERLMRRADVPIAMTQGFHPSPRMIFALSLSLGVLGSNEVLELELTRELPEEELLERLRSTAPPGLVFRSIRRIPLRTTAQVRRSFYRIGLAAPFSLETDVARLATETAARCERLLEREHLWMERIKPYHRRVDIRPFLDRLEVTPARANPEGEGRTGPTLQFTVWMTQFGTAKPDEVLRLLEVDHLPEQGAILERFDLELLDEVGPEAPPPPLVDPKAIISTTMEDIAVPLKASSEEESSPRPTSLLDGPMSFET